MLIYIDGSKAGPLWYPQINARYECVGMYSLLILWNSR